MYDLFYSTTNLSKKRLAKRKCTALSQTMSYTIFAVISKEHCNFSTLKVCSIQWNVL